MIRFMTLLLFLSFIPDCNSQINNISVVIAKEWNISKVNYYNKSQNLSSLIGELGEQLDLNQWVRNSTYKFQIGVDVLDRFGFQFFYKRNFYGVESRFEQLENNITGPGYYNNHFTKLICSFSSFQFGSKINYWKNINERIKFYTEFGYLYDLQSGMVTDTRVKHLETGEIVNPRNFSRHFYTNELKDAFRYRNARHGVVVNTSLLFGLTSFISIYSDFGISVLGDITNTKFGDLVSRGSVKQIHYGLGLKLNIDLSNSESKKKRRRNTSNV